MSFAAPGWLLFLLPWLGLVLWLLSGQRHRVHVPFLELWSGPVTGPKVKRTIQPPPIALACVLGALLLSILGAAAPAFHSGSSASHLTLIVDRGITMAPHARLSDLPAISAHQLIFVPAWSGTDWKGAPPSAIETSDLLQSAVAQALSSSSAPVVVISDQKLSRHDSRIIQIAPQSVPQNVGIVRLAAVDSPKPQVMVRVRNQSALKSCQLTVSSGAEMASQNVDLPAFDAEANLFVDLPKLGDVIEAKLTAADDLSADNTAWLVRQRTWPSIEVRSQIPAELRWMIDIYQEHRPPSGSSTRVSVVESLSALPADLPAVAILQDGSSAKPTSGRVGVQFGDHPLIANVDWREVVKDAVAVESPGEGWTPMVTGGSQVLVAVREKPARQVWVGFSSPSFPKLKDYVIFWTNVFDWIGQAGDEFTSEPMQQIGGEWKLEKSAATEPFDLPPGIYRRSDGARQALNAIDIRFSPPIQTDWKRQLAALSKSQSAAFDARALALILALFAIATSCMLWKRGGSFIA
jgi:hypothetical protein